MFAACGHDSTKTSDPAPAVAPKPAAPPEAKPFLVIDQPLDQWFGADAPISGLVMRG
jgi:hypothetical protein